MKKIGIIILLAILSLLHFSCGNEGCGGPYSNNYNPYPGIEIWLNKNYISDSSMKIKLIEPKVYYRTESKTALPLLVNHERMVFEISKQDTVLDSLIINYKMKAIYEDRLCDGEGYYADVTLKSCYSTGHYFELSYYLLNKYY
ncbi:MAG: hypothetical protein ACEQSR_12735 [Candidatus Methylacidiphilales bacterium]